MNQVKLFKPSDEEEIYLEQKNLECEIHNLPKKYFIPSLTKFDCELCLDEDNEKIHFKKILDDYTEDIKKIKSQISDENNSQILKINYNKSFELLKILFNQNENFKKEIDLFCKEILLEIYYSVNQDREIYSLKILIEGIKFLSNGKANYIGIGADRNKEFNYLALANILIQRNLKKNPKDVTDSFFSQKIINSMGNLEESFLKNIEKMNIFLRYFYDYILPDIAKKENFKINENKVLKFYQIYNEIKEFNLLKKNFEITNQQNKELDTQVKSLEEKLLILQKENELLKQNQHNLNIQSKLDKENIKSMENIISDLSKKLNNLQKENEILLNNNKTNEIKKKKDKENIESLEKIKKDLAFKLLNLQKENEFSIKKYESQIKKQKETIDEIAKNSDFLKQKNSEFQSENEKFTINIQDLEYTLTNYQSSVNKFDNKIKEMTIEINSLKEINQKQKISEKEFLLQIENLNKKVYLSEEKLKSTNEKLNKNLKENYNSEEKSSTKILNLNILIDEIKKEKKNFEEKLLICENKMKEEKINYEEKLKENKNKLKISEENYQKLLRNLNTESCKNNSNLSDYENKLEEIHRVKNKEIHELKEFIKKNSLANVQAEQKVNDLVEKNDKNIKKILLLEKEIDEKNKNFVHKSELEKFEDKIKELNGFIFDLKCLNSALNTRISDLEFSLSVLENRNIKLMEEYENFKKVKNNSISNTNSNFNTPKVLQKQKSKKQEDNEIEILLTESNKKLKEITSLYELDKKKLQNIEKMKLENEKNKQTIFILEKKIRDLNLIIKENQKIPEAKNSTNSENLNTNIENQLENLIEENKNLKNFYENFSQKSENLQNLQTEEMNIQLKTLINQNKILTLRIEELEKEKSYEKNKENFPDEEKNKEMKKKYGEIFIKKEKLEKELIEKKKKISEMFIANENLNAQFNLFASENNSKNDYENILNNLKIQNKNYFLQLEEISKNKLKLELENKELNSYLSKFKNEFEPLKDENEKNKNLIKNLKEEINELKKYEKKFDIVSNSKYEIEKSKYSLNKNKSERSNYVSSENNRERYNSYVNNNFNTFKDSNEFNSNNLVIDNDFLIKNPENLLLNLKYFNLIKNWFSEVNIFNTEKITLNLIMKASKDGFNWETFREKCNGKGPTLIVLNTSHNKLIGGFTPLSWNYSNKDYLYSPDKSNKSFLFSLTLGKRYLLKNNDFAICNGPQMGPIFGGGSDLEIVNNCNIEFNHFCDIGHTYDYNGNPEDFYGGLKFTVKDYEVYEVNY